jgi:hypothetical protein
MKKIRTLGLILLSVAVLSLLAPMVQAEQIAHDLVAGGDIDIDSPPWNTITFYSNYSRRFYAFFEHDLLVGGFTTFYVHSIDGITWSDPIRLFEPDVGQMYTQSTGKIDFYLEPNGRYVHIAVIYTPGSPNQMEYAKRELFMNGSLGYLGQALSTPISVWNTVPAGTMEVNKEVDIYLDNESYAYISFTMLDAGGFEWGGIIWSDYPIPDNGSWGVGDYTYLQWQDEFGNLWDDDWKTTVTGTWDEATEKGVGRGVHWMQTHENSLASNLEVSASAFNYFNGSGWINHDGSGDSSMWDHEGGDWADNTHDIAFIGNITIIVKQEEFGNSNISLGYSSRVGGGDWSNGVRRISDRVPGDAGNVTYAPHIGIDENRNIVIVWNQHHPDNDTVWYRHGVVEYDGTITWTSNQTLWQQWENVGAWDYQLVGSGMAEPLPEGVPLSLIFADNNLDILYHDYIFPLEGEELSLPAYHLNSTLKDANGNIIGEDGVDNWIFEKEVYTLESYVENVTSFFINTTDSRHEILFMFDNSTSEMSIQVDPGDQFTIGLVHTEVERFGNVSRLLWRFVPDRSIIDSLNNTWGYNATNSDMSFSASGSLGIQTHFYNLGGFTDYTFTGDGGRIAGGHPFEIFATNGTDGSSARAEQIYRKLQGSHFLIEIDMDNEWEGGDHFDIDPGVGFVDIGIDYRLNASWVPGFYVRLYVQDADVGHHAGANDHNWVEWSVDWYNYDPGTGTQQNFRSGLIYSNHWGYDNENLTPDYHNRTSSQLWVDLWFDRTNASTTVAGQVNAQYHGMREHGSAWWFGYGAFQPMISDYGNALMLDDLYDEGGNVTDSMKFDLMRLYVEVGKVANPADGDDETWTIRAIENFNRKQAEDRMQGIEQPAFEETLVLDMPMYQSNNPLIRAIDGISTAIWAGALGFQKIVWAALDSFFEWAGFGAGFFSQITAFVMMIPDLFVELMDSMGLAITHLINMIDAMFGMVLSILPEFVMGLTWLSGSIIDYIDTFVSLINGGLLDFSLIEDLQLGDWVRAGFAMLPTWEAIIIMESSDPAKKAKERIDFYGGLFNGALRFIRGFIVFMQQAISTIMDILPG